ncbi:MOSC domain-containing protein [Billgrantia tianxiuensis]|uniref:MOSC domain-containing protein n=1 Tax=Billgrantia tianxiuensis TaxID=2497861 RepID=A0A6I6SIX7_9GAMM|nr:MOSC N-terminal beta barrel domain-containing protein [Halomonas tianxiuensis]MCE8032625.1 MOSC domain-containing protein [Halomonas sp. MCCC 1A11057]QHC49452.1 MOSC domain-containing protein [Halomonas tianxiuensis]
MRIAELNIYPVKSLSGITLERATLGVRGLAYDRHWMVVDQVGRFITQRQMPGMARVTVRLERDALVLEHPEAQPLVIALERRDQPRLTAYVWDDTCQALDEGEEASRWLTAVLGDLRGSALRLVRFDDEHRRPVDSRYLKEEEAYTAFADGFPFLVASTASLEALNRELQQKGLVPLPMNRFRPNVVIEGSLAFAEDGWSEVAAREGHYRFGLRKPCQRCKIITIDQSSGAIDVPGEPLQTLIQMKTQPLRPGAYFGQNATLLEGAAQTIGVGDELLVS